MIVTTVFRNNKTQAVRLPKSVALPEEIREVEVRVVGDSRVISPVGASWDDWFDTGEPVTEAFADAMDGALAGSDQPRETWWN